MKIFLFLIILLFNLPKTFTFSWPWKQDESHEDPFKFLKDSAYELMETSGLSNYESTILKNALASLESSVAVSTSSKDCVQPVLVALQRQCHEFETAESVRVRFAIAISECHVKEATQDFPSPCQAITKQIKLEQPALLRRCLRELYEVSTLWTSYSNALGQVLVTCLATKFPLERRLLAQLQGNLSLLQISIVEQFQRQYSKWTDIYRLQSASLDVTKRHHDAVVSNFQDLRKETKVLKQDVDDVFGLVHTLRDYVHRWQTNSKRDVAKTTEKLDNVIKDFSSFIQRRQQEVDVSFTMMQASLSRLSLEVDQISKDVTRHREQVSELASLSSDMKSNFTELLALQRDWLYIVKESQKRQIDMLDRFERHVANSTAQLNHLLNGTVLSVREIHHGLRQSMLQIAGFPWWSSSTVLLVTMSFIKSQRMWLLPAVLTLLYPDYEVLTLLGTFGIWGAFLAYKSYKKGKDDGQKVENSKRTVYKVIPHEG